MKKNIIIGALAITTIVSLLYAFAQKSRADKHQELATRSFDIATELIKELERTKKESEEQRHIAQRNATEAIRQRELLEEQLKKVKKEHHNAR